MVVRLKPCEQLPASLATIRQNAFASGFLASNRTLTRSDYFRKRATNFAFRETLHVPSESRSNSNAENSLDPLEYPQHHSQSHAKVEPPSGLLETESASLALLVGVLCLQL